MPGRTRLSAKPPKDREFSIVTTLRRGLDEVVARQYVFQVLVGAWVFSVGATVGSFLNVVVYRLPAGKSLVRPGSRCPKCDSPIRPIHNIPILGWFILRGRCWDCGLRISPRYPLVETLVAFAFLLLAVCELFTQGANLPVRDPAAMMSWGSLWARDLQFTGVYLLHAVLVCTLLGAALIQYDGHRLPASLILPALVAALAAPLWWPSFRPVPIASAALAARPEWSLALIDGIGGLAVGATLGALSSNFATARERTFPLMLIGATLGWQAVVAIGVTASVVQLVAAAVTYAPASPRCLYATWLVIATLAWIIFWKQITTAVPFLGADASWPTLIGGLTLTTIAGRLEHWIEPAATVALTPEPTADERPPVPTSDVPSASGNGLG